MEDPSKFDLDGEKEVASSEDEDVQNLPIEDDDSSDFEIPNINCGGGGTTSNINE